MLQANACRFDKNSSTLCPLCGVCSEDEEHFLWDCNELSSLRESLLSEIKCVLGQLSEDFMQLDTRSRTLCLFGGNCYLLETADGATKSNTGVSPPNVCNTLYSAIIPVYIYIAI